MKIYTLTSVGTRLARRTNSEESSGWKLIHYLDQVGHSTSEQAADYTGLPQGEVQGSLSKLRRAGIVKLEE